MAEQTLKEMAKGIKINDGNWLAGRDSFAQCSREVREAFDLLDIPDLQILLFERPTIYPTLVRDFYATAELNEEFSVIKAILFEKEFLLDTETISNALFTMQGTEILPRGKTEDDAKELGYKEKEKKSRAGIWKSFFPKRAQLLADITKRCILSTDKSMDQVTRDQLSMMLGLHRCTKMNWGLICFALIAEHVKGLNKGKSKTKNFPYGKILSLIFSKVFTEEALMKVYSYQLNKKKMLTGEIEKHWSKDMSKVTKSKSEQTASSAGATSSPKKGVSAEISSSPGAKAASLAHIQAKILQQHEDEAVTSEGSQPADPTLTRARIWANKQQQKRLLEITKEIPVPAKKTVDIPKAPRKKRSRTLKKAADDIGSKTQGDIPEEGNKEITSEVIPEVVAEATVEGEGPTSNEEASPNLTEAQGEGQTSPVEASPKATAQGEGQTSMPEASSPGSPVTVTPAMFASLYSGDNPLIVATETPQTQTGGDAQEQEPIDMVLDIAKEAEVMAEQVTQIDDPVFANEQKFIQQYFLQQQLLNSMGEEVIAHLTGKDSRHAELVDSLRASATYTSPVGLEHLPVQMGLLLSTFNVFITTFTSVFEKLAQDKGKGKVAEESAPTAQDDSDEDEDNLTLNRLRMAHNAKLAGCTDADIYANLPSIQNLLLDGSDLQEASTSKPSPPSPPPSPIPNEPNFLLCGESVFTQTTTKPVRKTPILAITYQPYTPASPTKTTETTPPGSPVVNTPVFKTPVVETPVAEKPDEAIPTESPVEVIPAVISVVQTPVVPTTADDHFSDPFSDLETSPPSSPKDSRLPNASSSDELMPDSPDSQTLIPSSVQSLLDAFVKAVQDDGKNTRDAIQASNVWHQKQHISYRSSIARIQRDYKASQDTILKNFLDMQEEHSRLFREAFIKSQDVHSQQLKEAIIHKMDEFKEVAGNVTSSVDNLSAAVRTSTERASFEHAWLSDIVFTLTGQDIDDAKKGEREPLMTDTLNRFKTVVEDFKKSRNITKGAVAAEVAERMLSVKDTPIFQASSSSKPSGKQAQPSSTGLIDSTNSQLLKSEFNLFINMLLPKLPEFEREHLTSMDIASFTTFKEELKKLDDKSWKRYTALNDKREKLITFRKMQLSGIKDPVKGKHGRKLAEIELPVSEMPPPIWLYPIPHYRQSISFDKVPAPAPWNPSLNFAGKRKLETKSYMPDSKKQKK